MKPSMPYLKKGGNPPFKMGLAFAILFMWMSMVVYSFWYFQLQYSTAWVTFDGSQLEKKDLILVPGKLSVVHFVNPDCPCSRFSEPHIAEIEASIGVDGVTFQKVVNGDTFNPLPPASPSVAVWNEDGRLIYFGPYSSGEICGKGKDLLSQVLRDPDLSGQLTHQEAIGCFCEWPNSLISNNSFRKV